MPLPAFDTETGFLPVGDHEATMSEIQERFCGNYRRKEIFKGLSHVVEQLTLNAVDTIWIDGSFTTDKLRPDDVDVVYVPPAGANTNEWGLLAFKRRKDLKKYPRVDLWPHPSYQTLPSRPTNLITIKDFFCQKFGVEKGIVLLAMESS